MAGAPESEADRAASAEGIKRVPCRFRIRRSLPERFSHSPQVFVLLLQPLQLGQDLGELPAGPFGVFAVSHQVTPDIEEECAPG